MPLLLVSRSSAADALLQPFSQSFTLSAAVLLFSFVNLPPFFLYTYIHTASNHSKCNLSLLNSSVSTWNPPPATTKTRKPGSFSDFLSDLDTLPSIAATIHREFLINGDFNRHLDNPDDSQVKQFLSVLDATNLTQHISFPTHQDLDTLDLVVTVAFSSLSSIIDHSPVSPSDHFPIFTTLFYLRWLFHHCLLLRFLNSLSDASNLSVSFKFSVILSTLGSSLSPLLIFMTLSTITTLTTLHSPLFSSLFFSSRQTRPS